MATKLISLPDRRFACRECPARCCRLPWRIRLRDEEARRYLADPWVRERAGPEGARVLERGVLPMREVDRRLECVFLDPDGLCSMQKREGHAYLPRSCQAFPFGFVRDEDSAVVAQLSQLCPSIRDNRGDPVDGQLPSKLQQKGEVGRMSDAMSTQGGLLLSQPQYLRVVRRWEARLGEGGSPAAALAQIYDWTIAFEGALLGEAGRATDASVEAALDLADRQDVEPVQPRATPSFPARALFASLLGLLCYPSRLRLAHRIGRAGGSLGEALRSLGNKLAWLLGRGTVDMLFLPGPLELRRVRAVPRFLSGDEGSLVADFLRLVLRRRQIFCAEPLSLVDVIVDLALSTTLISHFARCHAAAAQRERVTPEDVREGISVAEMLLSSHASLDGQRGLSKHLRRLLATNRTRLRETLATEA